MHVIRPTKPLASYTVRYKHSADLRFANTVLNLPLAIASCSLVISRAGRNCLAALALGRTVFLKVKMRVHFCKKFIIIGLVRLIIILLS